MGILKEFTSEMLLRSSYGDAKEAIKIAKKCACFYAGCENEICRSRLSSLISLIEDFERNLFSGD